MCVNCVASIDSAAMAVGGVAGLRAWLNARAPLRASPLRKLALTAVLLLIVVALAGVALVR